MNCTSARPTDLNDRPIIGPQHHTRSTSRTRIEGRGQGQVTSLTTGPGSGERERHGDRAEDHLPSAYCWKGMKFAMDPKHRDAYLPLQAANCGNT
jgi:hypothetical protein